MVGQTLSRSRTVKNAAYWAAVCRSHRRTPFLKTAAPIVGGDIPFEQAFSNLAHAKLKETAPQLLDYELGFQLMEKNEDNNKAVGVFGFQVGPELLYAPQFFLKGELKGYELLWLKGSDTFVPLEEDWVNYILNRKPPVLGENTPQNVQQLGVERPSLAQFHTSPAKMAGYVPSWLAPGLPGLAAARQYRDYEPVVPHLIKSSALASMALLKILEAAPTLAKPINECYGEDLIKTAMANAATLLTIAPVRPAPKAQPRFQTGSIFKEAAADPINTGMLQIFVDDGERPAGLTEKEAETLKREGLLIRDHRDSTSKAYDVREPVSLGNPSATGLYEVLCKPDTFEKCLYIHSPISGSGGKLGGILVRIDDGAKKSYTCVHPSKVFVIEQYAKKPFDTWLGGLPDADDLQRGAKYVFITPSGEGTTIGTVRKSMSSTKDEKSYEIDWRDYCFPSRPANMPKIYEKKREYDGSGYSDANRVVLGQPGNKIRVTQGVVYLPKGTKALKLESPDPDDIRYMDCPCCDSESSDPPALEPGNHIDLQLGIYKASSALSVSSNGIDCYINNNRMSTKAGLISLIRDYGMSEKTARAVLTHACKDRKCEYRVKLAAPYDMIRSAPGGPPVEIRTPEGSGMMTGMMGNSIPANYYQEEEIPIPGLRMANPLQMEMASPLRPQPQVLQGIQQAAQTGQKEVMDTSLLSGLLKQTSDDMLIDQYIGPLVTAIDKCGRLLYNLYWHWEAFADRYGESKMPELEDLIRNTFQNNGKLALALKQEGVSPLPGAGNALNMSHETNI